MKVMTKDGVIISPKNTFSCKKDFSKKGEKNFDKYYEDVVIKRVARRVGPGEEDFVLEEKEVKSKRDIKAVINSQASEAGMEAYMAPYLQTNTPLPAVEVTKDVQDFTKCPETLADAIAIGEEARKCFSKLPDDLKGKMTQEEFLKSFTQEKFNEWITKQIEKSKPKPKEEK